MSNRAGGHFDRIVAGCLDAKAYDLPPAILDAWRARERIAGLVNDLQAQQGRESVAALVQREATALVKAAGRNGSLATPGSALIEAEAADHRVAAGLRIATTALDDANADLGRSIIAKLDVIVGNLDLAVAATLAGVRILATTSRQRPSAGRERCVPARADCRRVACPGRRQEPLRDRSGLSVQDRPARRRTDRPGVLRRVQRPRASADLGNPVHRPEPVVLAARSAG
jgi:hypothetical protein